MWFLFTDAYESCIYRLHQAVGTALLHVAWTELSGHPQGAVGPTWPRWYQSWCARLPASAGRGREAGTAAGVGVPHGLQATVLVHQDEGRVEQATLPGVVVVGPRCRGATRRCAVRPLVVRAAGGLRGWAEEMLRSDHRAMSTHTSGSMRLTPCYNYTVRSPKGRR